jgi:hypothetical protein
MAFGARQEADGRWVLCLRKGRTVDGWSHTDGSRTTFEFASQRRAKACADELNETFWDQYRKYKLGDEPPAFANDMTDCIRKHWK